MDTRTLESEPDYEDIDSYFANKEKHGLEEGFKLLLTYMTNKQAPIKITSSSGSSVVFISPNSDHVVQLFADKNLVARVCDLLSEVYRGNYLVKIKCEIEEDCGDLDDFGDDICDDFTVLEEIYDLPDYLVPFEVCIPDDKLIVWKKITPLNSVPDLHNFLEKNYSKLIWDLAHALDGLHSIRITHGDSTLDNVGIFNGKFVYYDFDMSKMTPNSGPENRLKIMQQFSNEKSKDFSTLSSSIKYHMKKSFAGTIQQVLIRTMEENGLSAIKAQEYLRGLTIEF